MFVDESKLDALGPGFGAISASACGRLHAIDATASIRQSRATVLRTGTGRDHPFCHEHTIRVVGDLPALKGKCKPVLRMGSSSNNQNDGDNIAVTDNGNYIVDLVFDKPIADAPAAAAQLKNTCGVVDHGFFIGMTTAVIIAGQEGISVKTP